MTDIAKAIADAFPGLDISGDTRESLTIVNREGGPVPTDAEIDAAIAAYSPPPIQDWEAFREALYSNADFLDFLESSPLAAKLDDLIWRRQFSPLATTLWQRLKSQGLISAELEQFVAGEAFKAGLGKELAIVTGA